MVSIIIPAYNVENYISRGLESCINQTYRDIEIVVVDDGSADKTCNIISQYAQQDARIRLFRQDNSGVSAARNRALAEAQGEYIVFLDGDDWLEENAVQTLMEAHRPGYLTCFDGYVVRYEQQGMTKRKRQSKEEHSGEIPKDKYIEAFCLWNIALGSSCYKLFESRRLRENRICFDEKVYNGEDGLFVIEYLFHCEGLTYRNIPLWNVVFRSGSATRSGYNPRMSTSIDAAEAILNYTQYDAHDLRLLQNYYTLRAVSAKKLVMRWRASVPAGEMAKIDAALRKYYKEYMSSPNPLQRKVRLWMYLYLPAAITAPLLGCIYDAMEKANLR